MGKCQEPLNAKNFYIIWNIPGRAHKTFMKVLYTLKIVFQAWSWNQMKHITQNTLPAIFIKWLLSFINTCCYVRINLVDVPIVYFSCAH